LRGWRSLALWQHSERWWQSTRSIRGRNVTGWPASQRFLKQRAQIRVNTNNERLGNRKIEVGRKHRGECFGNQCVHAPFASMLELCDELNRLPFHIASQEKRLVSPARQGSIVSDRNYFFHHMQQ
jgi:hypothetical protein